MKKRLFMLVLMASMIVMNVFTGCKKDKEPEPAPAPAAPVAPPKPTITSNAKVVNAPASLAASSSSEAQMANAYITQMNAMSSYSSSFTPASGATSTGTGAYSWTVTTQDANGQPVTYTFLYTYVQSGSKNIWDVKIKINSGTTYDFMHAEENTDGSGGNMNIHYGAFTGLTGTSINTFYWEYVWTKDSSGNMNVTMSTYENSTLEFKFVAKVNADGSGEISYYEGTMIFFKLTWTAAGTGTWTSYSGGVSDGTGTWQ